MDWKENLPLILGALALIIFQFFVRRKRSPETSQQELVQNLAAEVRLNLRIADFFSFEYKARRFMTTTWQLNKNKLDFLDKALQNNISDAFIMVEDYNQQIAAAKKNKSTSYMANINTDKLKGLLAKCQEGLEQWLLLKTGSRNPPEKMPGMFDDLLGKR